MLKRFLTILSLSLVAVTATAEETYVAGEHYDVISPAIRTANPGKIEAAEFFWYGCGHCYTFEPMLAQWKKTLADDVSFRGVPAMWGGAMELHARAYYVARALKVEDKMDTAMFQTLNVDRKPLRSEKEIAELFAAHGVAEEDFSRAFNSFGVSSQVRQANATARAAKITGTPSMMVNGKYLITTRKAGGTANMLKVADFLIEKERAASGS
ncbi:thiol:disulfide interchange protein DsbA/DsbL [Seongchinamella sediminis]|uniref:Thiol:disulfide interchange protein n=1 Tax=Seongchinamella sediminis TaxID=2283635 RepID=A0A3L7DZL5_9GAMM|nr:thiol:disulfide interchange protein DsbA/DsbL [Seongchinamella sediminis]RLQ22109.1 thiol:disulfide interchange protein DsbA/DsbL [Seongchinamella sediminis]